MTIIKTIPPPQTVGDYRNSAVRHFNTCKILWRYISLPDSSNLKKLPQDDILKNIFYLMGYVAECAIKYRFLTDCYSLNDSDDETRWSTAPDRMKKHLEFVSPTSTNCLWSKNVITRLSSATTSRPIPIHLLILAQVVSSTTTSSVEEDMQASWEPTIRYHYAVNGLLLPPNQTDIEAFYQATKSLLHNLAVI